MSCKTFPDPIWVAWAGLGPTDLVRKQAGVTVIITDCFFYIPLFSALWQTHRAHVACDSE